MVGVGGKEAVIGGPLCGTRPNRRPPNGWMWLRESGTVKTAPTKDCEPYHWSTKQERWIYAGHLYVTCGGCGAQHAVTERCELCGTPLA